MSGITFVVENAQKSHKCNLYNSIVKIVVQIKQSELKYKH